MKTKAGIIFYPWFKLLVFVFTLALGIASPGFAASVVVTADRMIDVLDGRVVEEPVVVVTDGRIVSVVGRGGARPIVPVGATRIDLPGKTLLPGLIDMHVHLTILPEIGRARRLQYSDSFWSAVGVANAERTLRAGFTTVRNLGSFFFQDVGLRQAIDGGWIAGPRIVSAGYKLCATGGQCEPNEFPPSFDRTEPSAVNSPAEGRARVRWLHKYGAQVIKISATGSGFTKGVGFGGQELSREEMQAIVEEAHMLGLKVAAHAHGDNGIRNAILAGVDTIEHASLASDATIALAAQHHTWFDMDLYRADHILANGIANGATQQRLDSEKMISRLQREAFRKALRAGVPMLFGTDAGVYPHGDNGRQFARMVEWGMTPMQAIQSATRNAAMALDWETDVGAIAVGRWGDMIAVTGDPLADIRVLEHVDVVIKGGKLVKKD